MLKKLALFVSVLSLLPTQVFADGFGVEKFFEPGANKSDTALSLYVEPGQSYTGKLEITNDYDTQKTLKLYPKDGTQNEDGAFSFTSNEEKNVEFGAWTTLDKSQLTLSSKEKSIVSYTITIPKEVSKKEIAGVVAVEEDTTNAPVTGGNIRVNTRFSKRIHVLTSKENLVVNTVFKSFTVEKVSTKASDTYESFITLENKGNVFTYCNAKSVFNHVKDEYVDSQFITFFAIEPGTTVKKPKAGFAETASKVEVIVDCYPYHNALVTLDKTIKTLNEQSKSLDIKIPYTQTIKRQGKTLNFTTNPHPSVTESSSYSSSTYTTPDALLVSVPYILLTILAIVSIIILLVLYKNAKNKHKKSHFPKN
jgi:hypothetical protein